MISLRSRTACLFILLLLTSHISNAQNPPVMGDIPDAYLFNGSVTGTVFLPDIGDGDNDDQALTISAFSSNEAMVSVGNATYNTGDKTATLELTAAGSDGSADITVTVTDGDGSIQKSFAAVVGPYTNNGINFEVHDIVFWQEVIPLAGSPVFDTVIQSTEAPYNEINFDVLDITVNQVKDDFFTGLYKGYLVPVVSGEYRFAVRSENDCGVWLGETFENAAPLAVRSDNHGDHGTQDPSDNKMTVSAPVNLTAGQVYAIYGTQWIVHATYGGIQWEGPGIARDYIPGDMLRTEYDIEKPTAPFSLVVNTIGVNDLRFSWEESSDDNTVAGYFIYLNGNHVNEDPLDVLDYVLEGLTAETPYSLAVTAVDEVGNESVPTAVTTITTYQEDAVPPAPPTSATLLNQAGLALEIEWSGASDGETVVNGYNIYIGGVLFNNGGPHYGTSIVIDGLSPETEYSITIEAIDAAGNISLPSEGFLFSTSIFDPAGNNLGVRSGRFSFELDPFTYSYGIGINPNYKNGAVFNSAHEEMFSEFKPGAIRWGALTANDLSFSTYSGTGKSVTIAKFMNLCNNHEAITVFCCGVKNSTDWRSNQQTFMNFLEYIAGPAGTTYGDLRIAEGYTNSLLEDSPGLIFEFGNEAWGGVSHDAEIGENYDAYAAWCREIATLMKSSPYYDPEKILLAYSGRYPNPQNSYGLNDKLLKGDTGEVDLLAVSGYLGGNLNYDPAIPAGNSELDYYKNAYDLIKLNIDGMEHYAAMSISESDRVKSSYLYESNTTTPAYNARHGQAIVSIDYYLKAIESGSIVPSIFHLTNGQWRITDPNKGYERLPMFKLATLVNRFCKAYSLRGTYTTNDQIFNSEGELVDFEPVGCYAYQEAGSYTLVLLSRDFSADHQVQVDIPDGLTFNASGKMYTLTSDHYSSRTAAVDSAALTISDHMFVTVPAYGAVFITFSGDDLTSDEMPGLGAYDYVAASSIEITADAFEITEDDEDLQLEVAFTPENTFVKKVWWELSDNDIGATISAYPNRARVNASGECGGNGTVTVTAFARGNPEIYDQVEIEISGQTGPECSTLEQLRSEMVSVYPVPAKERVMVQLPVDADFQVDVVSIAGNTVRTEQGRRGACEMDVTALEPGIYLLNMSVQGRMLTRRMVLYN